MARDIENGDPSPVLRIGLFGRFDLWTSESDVRVESPRMRVLLTDLILNVGAARSRAHLAFTLWPDSSEKQARTNLRQLLHHLRRALPGPDRFVEATARTLTWRADAPCQVDAHVFLRALEAAADAASKQDIKTEMRQLRRAADAYRGPLVPECYDACLEAPRAEFEDRALRAFDRLVTLLEDDGDLQLAGRYAERLRHLDPLRERTYRQLISLYGRLGEPAKARDIYDACRAVLARQLQTSTSAETDAAMEMAQRSPNKPAIDANDPAPEPTAASVPEALVGRKAEWARLASARDAAAAGAPRLVVVFGEAGIGKTHLCEVFAGFARESGAAVARARAYAAEGRVAYAPVVEWLRSDACRVSLHDLDDPWLMEVARLMPDVRVDAGGPLPPPAQDGQVRLFEALARVVLAVRDPLVLIIDDVQWADPETLGWLRYLLRRDPSARLLVVATIRVEQIDPPHPFWALYRDLQRDGQLETINLGPLTASESTSLANRTAERALAPADTERLFRHTEGHPLFIVESIRSGRWDEPGEEASTTPFPPKVQAVLDTRLAQLSAPARAVAELAAAAGRAFDPTLLSDASRLSDETVFAALDELWRRRIIRPSGPTRYDFAHDRLREAAYRSAGPIRQTLLHRQLARALQALHHRDLDAVAAALAAHFDRAGEFDDAIRYYERAGETAQRVFAHHDASTFFERGLEVLQGVSQPDRYRETELRILEALGSSLVSLRNYADPRVRKVYVRAEALCADLGRPTSAPALRGLAISDVMQGDQAEAERRGRALLELARRPPPGDDLHDGEVADPVLLVEAHYVLGVNAFWQGRFPDAQRQLETAVAAYEPSRHQAHVSRYAQDPGLVCSIRLALTELYLGLPERAFARCAATLAQAAEQNHPMSWIYVDAFSTWIYLEGRQWERAHATATHMQRLIDGHDLKAYWSVVAQLYRTYAELALGTLRPRVEDICSRLERYTSPGAGRAQMVLLCAAACEQIGAPDAGLRLLDERLAAGDSDPEPYLRAEMLRVRARIRAATGESPAAVKRDLDQALRVAHAQGALMLELRAAADRLTFSGLGADESPARATLAQVYARFTEGFETPDLRSARRQIAGVVEP